MSSAVSTNFAPFLINALHPRASGLWMDPGIAKTSRPCSRASRAVINDPLWIAASTTRTPRLSPLITRFRRGKLQALGRVPGGNSLTRHPFSAIFQASCLWRAGYTRSGPVPNTATVLPPAFKLPSWAEESIPSANPLVMQSPAPDNAAAKSRAVVMPDREGLRLPTIES